MQPKIHLLSEQTINQIAAGEVIENPASVVKELTENSLDAEATAITVEIKGGGLALVRVADNGKGMGPEDAKLCLQRHATSKIVDADDLFRLTTMGFRGEALASIASISKLTLTTSDGSAPATRIESRGSQAAEVSIAARTQGTTVEVRSLFYNVPARLKFQKSTPRLVAEVTKALTELSLANPCVAFELIVEERKAFFVTAEAKGPEALLKRARAALQDPPSSKSLPLSFKEGDISLEGLLGAPSDARPNRLGQHLFINSRPVSVQALSFAVREGYGTRIEAQRFPIFVLHLTLPPALFDVNVHPQKKEVRLKEEAPLKSFVIGAVSRALCRGPRPIEQVNVSPPFFSEEPFIFKPSTASLRIQERALSLAAAPSFELAPAPLDPVGLFDHWLLLRADAASERHPLFNGVGLVFIDLLAARARLLYDALESGTAQVESQALLLPLTLSFSLAEISELMAELPLLEQCGFDLRPIGERSLLIDAHPPFLKECEIQEALLDLSKIKERGRKKAAYASRLARLGSKRFTLLEAVRLFEALCKSSDPAHCPLGRPTFAALTSHELERLFHPKKGEVL